MKNPLSWLCSLVLLFSCTATALTETSYFRIDHGRAADNDSAKLPDDFSSKSNLAWRTPLLPGNSTPCVVGDSVFLTTWEKDKQELATVALDRKTGKLKWKQVAPTKEIEEFHPVGSPASSTPASDGSRVFAFFGSYGLLCYDLQGNLQWEHKLGPFQDEFGASSSPVLVDGKIILNEDHDVDSFVIAIDAETGKQVWKTKRVGFTRSYSTPVVLKTAAGESQVLIAGALQLTAYNVADGKPVWWVRGLSRIVDTTPVVAGGKIFLATWTPGGDQSERISMEPYPEATKAYDKDGDGKIAKTELPEGPVLTRFFRIDLNQDEKLDRNEWEAHARVFELAQNVAMAIRPGGKGDVTETHVDWIHRRGLPTVPSPVVYRDVMYMVKDSGIVTSLDAGSGEPLKQGRAKGRGNYYASLVAGDGKVYLASERGVITVLKAAGRWDVLSSHDFGERIMATPVAVDGRMYIRTDDAFYCYTAK